MYVTAAAEAPMPIISRPLRTQFLLEKMVFITPTPKRVAKVPITEAMRASQLLRGKAKGNMGTRAARPKDTPIIDIKPHVPKADAVSDASTRMDVAHANL